MAIVKLKFIPLFRIIFHVEFDYDTNFKRKRRKKILTSRDGNQKIILRKNAQLLIGIRKNTTF